MSIRRNSSRTTINSSFNTAAVQTSNSGTIAPATAVIAEGSSGIIAPVITSIAITDSDYVVLDDTAVSTSGGYIKITGSGFKSGCAVYVGGVAATTTTFVSSTEVRAQIPAASNGTLVVYLINVGGAAAVYTTGVTYSGFPTWTTGSYSSTSLTVSVQLLATGDGTLSYSLQDGSSLPSGLTLSSTGLISGTASAEGVYTFTVLVDDDQLQTTQQIITFTITIADPYFKNTVLLLNGDGTNNANNAVFTDSSSNTIALTQNGEASQGSFSPFIPSGWSGYFDGTGDWLNATSGAIGSGNFTLEFWCYQTVSGNQYYFTNGTSPDWGDTNGVQLIEYQGNMALTVGSGNSNTVRTALSLNVWHHVAIVRLSGVVKLYVDGVAAATTLTTSTNLTGTLLRIGSGSGALWGPFNGYMSNFRIVSGVAVYTENFTPSTTELSAVPSTSFLTLHTYRFKDSSTNNTTITRAGDAKVVPFSPFAPSAAYSAATHGGSMYLDGTGDYINALTNAAFGFGTSDWTIEFWVYPTGASNARQDWVDLNTGAGQRLLVYYNGTNITVFGNGSGLITGPAIAAYLFQWNHIAVSKASGSTKLFVNGVQAGSTYSDSLNYGSTNPISIGKDSSGSTHVTGYMSDIRLLKGTGLYTAAFTPPTAPLTTVANTSFFLKCANAGISDLTGKLVLQTVGDAKVSTTQYKYGTASLSFDGAGDYLKIAATPLTTIGTNNFTIECWVYVNAYNGINNGYIYEQRVAAGTVAPGLLVNSQNVSYVTAGIAAITSASPLSLNTWYHLALCRSSGSTKLFINGTQAGSTYADTNNYVSQPVLIGSYFGLSAVNYFNGYIDDLRVTNGFARYTANFTPPTGTFQLL